MLTRMLPSLTWRDFCTVMISKLFINPSQMQTIRTLGIFWHDLRNNMRFLNRSQGPLFSSVREGSWERDFAISP